MNAIEAFRRERGLLSGDDLEAWLRAAGLDEEEWSRRVLAGDTGGMPGPLPTRPPPGRHGRSPVPLRAGSPPHEWVDAPRACGDAALRVVCRVIGAVPAMRVAEDATLADLVEAARAAGLPSIPLKASRRRLDGLPVPWIAHVDGGHWLVVHRADADEVVVSDPARGTGTLERGSFEARWTGWCAVFAPVVQSE